MMSNRRDDGPTTVKALRRECISGWTLQRNANQGTAPIPSCVVPEHHFRITILIDSYTVAAMPHGGQRS
jgi:hypothetical protein